MSTQEDIRNAVLKVEKTLKNLRAALKALQDVCKHYSVKKTYKSNTGNYDPSADCYWIECYCPDCHKHWDEKQ